MRKIISFLLSAVLLFALLAGLSSCGGSVTKGLEYTLLSDGTYAVTGGAEGAKTIRIPEKYNGAPVTALADRAFEYRDEIRALHLPASVTKIGQHVFGYSDNLTEITVAEENPVYHSVDHCLIETASGTLVLGSKKSRIPDDGSVTKIGMSAFLGRSTLTGTVLPEGITHIEHYAFAGCEMLAAVTVPDGVTSIGDSTFAFCSSLSDVRLPASVQTVGYGIFEGCEQELTVTYGGTVAAWNETFGARYLGATTLTVNCTDGVITVEDSYLQ